MAMKIYMDLYKNVEKILHISLGNAVKFEKWQLLCVCVCDVNRLSFIQDGSGGREGRKKANTNVLNFWMKKHENKNSLSDLKHTRFLLM